MKTSKSHLVAVALLVLPTAAVAGPSGNRGRQIAIEYTGPSSGVQTSRITFVHDTCSIDEPAQGCVVTRLRPRDRYALVRVRDEVGGPLVAAEVTVEDARGHFDFVGYVCGDSMQAPLALPRGYDFLEVHVHEGACYGSITPSIVTTGVVEMYLTTRPFQ